MKLIEACDDNFSELCERFRISRQKGYKWLERFEEGGLMHSKIDQDGRYQIRAQSPMRWSR